MSQAIANTIAKYTAGTLLGLGAFAWTAPIWRAPDVQAVAVAGAQSLALIGVTAGGVLIVGYVWNRLDTWARQRPPVVAPITLPLQFAHDQDALTLAYEEAQADPAPDPEDAWGNAITRFAFVSRWGGFGWRSMRHYVGYQDWQTSLDLLHASGVLSEPKGNQPSDWAPGWSYSKLRVSLKYGRLTLPYPNQAPPSVVWRA